MAIEPDSEFHRDLQDLGFRLVQEGRGGVLQYQRRQSPYLTYWVHHDPGAETALFTWELAIGEYLDGVDLQVGANEPLNQFVFPKHDARGPADPSFVVSEIDRCEDRLRRLDFVDGA